MVQRVQCLLYKCRDWSSDAQHPWKTPDRCQILWDWLTGCELPCSSSARETSALSHWLDSPTQVPVFFLFNRTLVFFWKIIFFISFYIIPLSGILPLSDSEYITNCRVTWFFSDCYRDGVEVVSNPAYADS